MDPHVSYNVACANNRRERVIQATALQEDNVYKISRDERNSTQDAGYSMIENNGRERFTSKNNTAYAINGEVHETETISIYNALSDTNRTRQGLTKKCVTKWFAILAIVAFVLSLLVAVAALVYTNIELKNQEVQLREQLKNQSSIIELLNHLGTINNPASSCSELPQDRPSGEYWIATNSTSSPVQVYCDMNRTSCSCNTAGGWTRVANLDMTDPNQNCPEGLKMGTRTEPPLRTCGRHESGCVYHTYSTYGVRYSHVCGRIIAYQNISSDGFYPYFKNRFLSIDDGYVDGVSLTHGQSPRRHIWTFANALDEVRSDSKVCPCTRPGFNYTGAVPPFIGQDYFCETGSRQRYSRHDFYSDDPLWDGQGCGGTSTCCEFNNPPWFCKQLDQPTTDDIEVRICGDELVRNEDAPIELVEMYIQ